MAAVATSGYQPVRTNSQEEIRHSPALIPAATKSISTSWMQSNQSKLISAWDFTAKIADLPENQTVSNVRAFLGLEQTKEEQKSWFMALIEMILNWLGRGTTAEDVFLKAMQKDLDQGCCHGISMSLMKALLEAQESNPKATIEDVISKLSKEDIILLQLLSNLRSEVYKLNQARTQQQLVIIGNRNLRPHTPKHEIPAEIKGESEEVLKTKLAEGKALIIKIDAAINKFMGFEFTEEKTASGDTNINGFLKDSKNNNAKIVISLCAKKDSPAEVSKDEPIAGHSIVLDLKNFAFFDINCGYYEFGSKEECIAALRARIKEDYKEEGYNEGTWIMRVVRPAVVEEAPATGGASAASEGGNGAKKSKKGMFGGFFGGKNKQKAGIASE